MPASPTSGRAEVICGPMFSGKSEELIRRLRRAMIAKKAVVCIKPAIDQRFHPTAIASHSEMSIEAIPVKDVQDIERVLDANPEAEVIGIDEAQFLSPEIIPLVEQLVQQGKRVIVAGLDTTFAGEPFAPMPDLMAIADEVTKLSAVCMRCGQPAIRTQRLRGGTERVVVGAGDVYEARCRFCFQPASRPGA